VSFSGEVWIVVVQSVWAASVLGGFVDASFGMFSTPLPAPSASRLTSTLVADLWVSFVKSQETKLSPSAALHYANPDNRLSIRAVWKVRFLAAIRGDKAIVDMLSAQST
jgi:hypothetical protein